MKGNNLESEFSKYSNPSTLLNQSELGKIDFNNAILLNNGGSTCDTYVTRINNRHIFIKRLKEEFRGNPLYMNAFRKEYEVAVSLRHKSLPVYCDFYEDYITMDFIDGRTLDDMIKMKDPWLIDKLHIRQMFQELLDVIAYLHDRNVIHCDIKANNIMLTFGSKHLYLIDLDKSYTSWYDNSSGSSSRFGISDEKTRTPQIDFRGIAKIIDKLEDLPGFPSDDFFEFKCECESDEVSLTRLEKYLREVNECEDEEKLGSWKKKRYKKKRDPDPKEILRLELIKKKEIEWVAKKLVLLDGPLEYNLNKESKTAGVSCLKKHIEECIEALIPSYINVKEDAYLVDLMNIGAFWGCTNLRRAEIPEGVHHIYRASFCDCVNLEYVLFKGKRKDFMGGVFVNCPNLKRIEFESLEEMQISDDFYGESSNQNVELVDLQTHKSYTIDEFKQLFCKPIGEFKRPEKISLSLDESIDKLVIDF